MLALCETWLKPNVPNRLLNIDGYKIYRCDRSEARGLAKGRGGVALLIRDGYRVEVLKTPVTGAHSSNLEVLWTKVSIGKCRAMLCASVYRVPTNTSVQVSADLEDLECQVQYMLASYAGATLIIAGDLNCCLLKSMANSPGERLRELLTKYGMTVANSQSPTYRPAGTLLDIIAVSCPGEKLRAGVTRCHYGTPHDYTRIILRCSGKTRLSGPVVRRRRLERIDINGFNRLLSDTDWSPVFRSQQTTDKWEAFRHIFLSQLDTVAPVARIQQRAPGSLPVSASTRDLMARRRQTLRPGGDRENYKEINRQCRAAARRDQEAHIERETWPRRGRAKSGEFSGQSSAARKKRRYQTQHQML